MSPISEQQTRDASQFAERANRKLAVAGGESAERAFGMGCAIGILPAFLAILVLFIFQVINLVLAFILAMLAGLALVGISALLATRARANTTRRLYEAEIQAEIQAYVDESHMSREQFDTLVYRLLPSDADLRAFLAPLQREGSLVDESHPEEVSEEVEEDDEYGGQRK
jgi:hypothetical protein